MISMSAAPFKNQFMVLMRYDYLPFAAAFAANFLRSAHRRFMASAIRLRPSGLSLRLRGVAAAFAFLLPLGRPGPLLAFTVVPASSSRAC